MHQDVVEDGQDSWRDKAAAEGSVRQSISSRGQKKEPSGLIRHQAPAAKSAVAVRRQGAVTFLGLLVLSSSDLADAAGCEERVDHVGGPQHKVPGLEGGGRLVVAALAGADRKHGTRLRVGRDSGVVSSTGKVKRSRACKQLKPSGLRGGSPYSPMERGR